jgi:outer membrane receptor for ferrienterochelin and colicin
MKQLFWLFITVFALSNGYTQSKFLEGTVYEAGDKNSATPIPGVNVYFPGYDGGTSTNVEGFFHIDVPVGASQIIFSFIGFKNDTVAINTLVNPVNIVMKDGSILPDVIIKAKKGGYAFEKYSPRDSHIMGEGELRKAACCNISESFETNPSIDASFTDAVTGTKQIQMLGLSGKYVQIMQDNVPMARGLSTIYGLEFVPGAWVNSIQISKGAGSVVNGYESMVGQINIEMKNPVNGEKLHVNYYMNTALRKELNIHTTQRVSKKWFTTILGHVKGNNSKMDMNGDGFLDNPLSKVYALQNQWNYFGSKIHSEIGVGGVYYDNYSGQYATGVHLTRGDEYTEDMINQITDNPYRVHLFSGKINGFVKLGYLFPDEQYKSIALQTNASYHTQLNNFGIRSYEGEQTSGYANLIFQDEIANNADHKYKTGLSFIYDDYKESTKRIQAMDTNYAWTEMVPGAYMEYSMSKTLVSLVAGVRADYHNIFGAFITPRFNMRISPSEKTAIKLAAGMGRRTPNVFMENVGALASSRVWEIQGSNALPVYGLNQEVAQNFGIGINQDLKLFGEDANLNVDFYHSRFVNQIVTDYDFSTRKLLLYNLEGQSYSNSAQVEFSFTPIKRLEVRMAYRFLDVKVDYLSGTLTQPLTSKHRGFINVAKETRKDKEGSFWKFDMTTQLIGAQRLSQTLDNPIEHQREGVSKDFILLNLQMTYIYQKRFEFYVGVENLTNFKLKDPIISANDPFSENFDASMVWGPVFGRMGYFGIRYTIE